MKTLSPVLKVLLVWSCLLLGYLYVESQGVSPRHHRFYQSQLARLEALDARFDQNVLRIDAGLMQSYDPLVRDRLETERVHALVVEPPAYFAEEDRARYRATLERCMEASRAKQERVERFKTTHAAARNSLLYLPIASRALLDGLDGQDGMALSQREQLRDHVSRIVEFVASPGTTQRRAAEAAVLELRALVAAPPGRVDVALLEAVATHAANVLERKPPLTALVRRIVDSPTGRRLEALHDVFRSGHSAAVERADRFQVALYGVAAAMVILVVFILRRLDAARSALRALSENLERRVEERTADLARTRDQLEELNEDLSSSYEQLDANRREQLELRDKFLSHVSHELRTPLAAVHQFVSLILDEVAGPVPDQQREYLEITMRNADQLNRMIADLMEVTRARSGKLRIECHPMDVDGLVRDAAKTLEAKAAAAGIELAYAPTGDAPPAYADPVRVRQVLSNLIENAIKFTPEGGRIEIGLDHDPDASTLVVSVRDTGCGIPPDSLDRVFDQLHQEGEAEIRSRKGLGLGLAICRELVERQAGRIWVESELGEGSTFFFSLRAFRLVELIEDVLLGDAGLRAESAVVRVAVRPSDPGNLTEAIRRDVRHTLRGLVYRESDVVLPLLDWRADREDFWILADSGANGAEAIRARIHEKLTPRAEADAYHFSIEARVFELSDPREPDFEKQVEAIANHIQDRTGAEEERWLTT